MAHPPAPHTVPALAALNEYDDSDFSEDEFEPSGPLLMICNGPAESEAAESEAAGSEAPRPGKPVWLELVVPGPDGGNMDVRVAGIMGKVYKDGERCTVAIKGVSWRDLKPRGKKRRGHTRRQNPPAAASPAGAAGAASPRPARPASPRPASPSAESPASKRQRADKQPSETAVARILVLSDPASAAALLANLQPLSAAPLFVAAKPGTDIPRELTAKHRYTEVGFCAKTYKKAEVLDLRAIATLVATWCAVDLENLFCGISYDADAFPDAPLASLPNLALLDEADVRASGIPDTLTAIAASPAYSALTGGATRVPPQVSPQASHSAGSAGSAGRAPRAATEIIEIDSD
jgi:hypothetical protein